MNNTPGFMEFIRGIVTESAANTYTETEVATPVGRSVRQAMLIWFVDFSMDAPVIEDSQANSITANWFKATQSAASGLSNPDVIARQQKSNSAGAIQGSLSEYFVERKQGPDHQVFDPPILYANSSIFLGIQGVGNGNALACASRIGYTIEKVSLEEFLEALVE